MTIPETDANPEHDHAIVMGEQTYGGEIMGHDKPVICYTKGFYTPARLAEQIATRFAIVAAMPDGEDSSGRQKLRMPTADELAQRSCDIAAALWKQFGDRDWLYDIPLPVKRPKKERETA